jgi:hypothetical protein
MDLGAYQGQFAGSKPAYVTDPLEISSQLAEALLLLEQCQARSLAPSQDLLDYIDSLLELVEELQFYGRIAAA